MRKLIINLVLFFAALEGMARVNLFVLLTAMGGVFAAVIWTDLLLDSTSPR